MSHMSIERTNVCFVTYKQTREVASSLRTPLHMGFVMDSLSMIFLTIPIFWPIIAVLDFGMSPDEAKLWFGIIALIVVEMGLITPPVGLNVFIINSMANDVPMIETFKGVIPSSPRTSSGSRS